MKIASINSTYSPIFGNTHKKQQTNNNTVDTNNIMLSTGSIITATIIGLTISGKKGHGPLKNIFNKNKLNINA